jgi:hypothetical protein
MRCRDHKQGGNGMVRSIAKNKFFFNRVQLCLGPLAPFLVLTMFGVAETLRILPNGFRKDKKGHPEARCSALIGDCFVAL